MFLVIKLKMTFEVLDKCGVWVQLQTMFLITTLSLASSFCCN